MPRNRRLKVVVGVASSFIGLAATIVLLLESEVIGSAMAKLMLVALLGIYVGFGFLIAVYRLIGKLD